MENNKLLWIWYSDTSNEKNKKVTIKVDYLSKTEISNEEYVSIKVKFSDYIKNQFDSEQDDIIDVVDSIRYITKDLDERRLRVCIEKDDYKEEVFYENGLAYSCNFHKEVWDDVISVSSSHKGIDVKYKKDSFYLDSEEKVNSINSELNTFYKKIIMLNSMSKEIKKDTSFKLVNIPRRKRNED
jgi:hypothetical protein